MSRGGSRGRWALLRLVSVVSLVPEWGGCLDLVGQLLSRPLPTRSPTYLLRRCPAPECSSDGRPLRRREGPVPPPKDDEDEGFVFGSSALSRSVDALRDGKMILCAEDGEPGTLISVMVLPQHLTEEHVAFVRKHAISLEVSLAPQQYRELYGSLDKITLDNNNLAVPALSVSARGADASAANSTSIARTIRALCEPEAARAGDFLNPGAVAVIKSREGGVLRRAGVSEAAVELAGLAGAPPVGVHATLRASGLHELRKAALEWEVEFTSIADLVAQQRRQLSHQASHQASHQVSQLQVSFPPHSSHAHLPPCLAAIPVLPCPDQAHPSHRALRPAGANAHALRDVCGALLPFAD